VTDVFSRDYLAQWGDMDFNQHMANSAFLDYASNTRMLFLESQGVTVGTLMERQIGPVTIEDTITYRREIRMLERFTVDYRIVAHRPDFRRARIRNAISTDAGACATVETTVVWVDLAERRPIRPPADICAAFAALAHTDDFEEWA
jgi:acyl-CoA thioester hydrolase